MGEFDRPPGVLKVSPARTDTRSLSTDCNGFNVR